MKCKQFILKTELETADCADERGYQKITEYQGFTSFVTRLKRGLFGILFYPLDPRNPRLAWTAKSRFIWISLFAVALTAAAQPVPLPNVIFRPTFLSPDIAHNAGMAFRVKDADGGGHYFVTAHTLFGPAADLDVQMSSEDIARVIVAAVGVSCTDPKNVVVARNYVPLPGARRADDKGSEKDIAVFELPNKLNDLSLVLDPSPMVRGERVWLFVKYNGTNRVGLEGAIVAYVTENEIRYVLENQEVDLKSTTGAPVLSKEGKVVGMHLGVFSSQTQRRFGFAAPAAAIRAVWAPLMKKDPTVLK